MDTTQFFPIPELASNKQWDYGFVGMLVGYKRPWLLANKKQGSRIAVGRIDLAPDMSVRSSCASASVCQCSLAP